MNSVTQVLKELKKCGSEQTRRIYAQHGAGDNIFGVKAADLKVIAKKIKGKHCAASVGIGHSLPRAWFSRGKEMGMKNGRRKFTGEKKMA